MGIGNLTTLLGAQRRLASTSDALGRVYERLSSGQRINRASDDAAGLAVSTNLRNDSRVYGQAIRNGNDAISALSIADGALGELSGIVTRIKELATQSANGSLSLVQRLSLDDEGAQLTEEFNRIRSTTKFNGISLLDISASELSAQLGYGSAAALRFGLTSELRRSVGNGFASASALTVSGTGSVSVSGGDFNGDGKQDLIGFAEGSGASVQIYLGNGDGTFSSGQSITAFTAGSSIVTGDFTGDGVLDYALGDATGINVFRGNGDGTFNVTPVTTVVGNLQRSMEVGDFDGDGALDLVAASGSGSISVYRNNGAGTFSTLFSDSAALSTSIVNIFVRDLDGNGSSDIVLHSTFGGGVIKSYLNSGQGSFSASSERVIGATNSLAIADLDHDGFMDAIAIGGGNISSYRGIGGGAFSSSATFQVASGGMTSVVAGDFNGDGEVDLVLSRLGASVMRLGNGDGSFKSAVTQGGLAFTGSRYTLSDYNNDGVLDIAGTPTIAGIMNVAIASTTSSTSIERFDLTTRAQALAALTKLDGYMQRISLERGTIGSSLSRLQTSLAAISGAREAFESAAARISDADVASETAEATRLQILRDTGSAILGQANQDSRLVLKLLGSSA